MKARNQEMGNHWPQFSAEEAKNVVAYVAGALASVPAMQTAGRAASNAMAGKGAAVVGLSAGLLVSLCRTPRKPC